MRDKALLALLGVALSAFMLGFLAGRGHSATSPCSYRDGGVLPDRACTPGATNPAVTQGDIRSTICHPGWTSIVRPSSSVTRPEKIRSMRDYGVGDRSAKAYEYDHLIPLELGGAVNDPRNLWPEPHLLTDEGAYGKDAVEDALHAQVCAGTRRLRSAQLAIVRDWRKALD